MTQSGKIEIRELNKSDAKALAAFLAALPAEVYAKWNRFGFSGREFDPHSVAARQCEVDHREEKGFVAVADGNELVGYSYLRFFPDKKTKAHNASLGIVIAPSYQGKGVGKRLMVFMHDWAKVKGYKKIWLATYATNKNALRLYRQLGYEVEGVFMYDERNEKGWDHVVSLALLLADEFKDAPAERRRLIKELEEGAKV